MTPSQANINAPVNSSQAQKEARRITIDLRSIPILQGLSSEVMEQVARALVLRRFAKGDHVVHKGSPGDALLFLLAGSLQAIDMTIDGKEIGLSFIRPGDYFGELSIVDDLPRSASIVAIEPALVALLPRAQAQALIYKNPQVAEKVLRRLAASVRRASDYRTILGIPNAYQRVYALLLQLSTTAPGGLVVINDLPRQKEMAIMVNTSRETVSRALGELLQRGIVEKDLRRLIVRHPWALEEAAQQAAGLKGSELKLAGP